MATKTITITSTGSNIDSKPFVHIHERVVNVIYSAGGTGNAALALYDSGSSKKLKMAKIWLIGSALSADLAYQFFKGAAGAATTEISRQYTNAELVALMSANPGHSNERPHITLLIGGAANDDLVLQVSAAGTPTVNINIDFDMELFYEDV